MNVSTLTHQELYRPSRNCNGCSVVERRSADFVVDGGSLLQALVKADGGHTDFMGVLCKGESRRKFKVICGFLVAGSGTDGQCAGVDLHLP